MRCDTLCHLVKKKIRRKSGRLLLNARTKIAFQYEKKNSIEIINSNENNPIR